MRKQVDSEEEKVLENILSAKSWITLPENRPPCISVENQLVQVLTRNTY